LLSVCLCTPLTPEHSIAVNCYWPSPAQSFLVSSPVGTHAHIFVLSKTFTCSEMGPPLRREQVKVTLRPTISRSVSPRFEPHVGLVTGRALCCPLYKTSGRTPQKTPPPTVPLLLAYFPCVSVYPPIVAGQQPGG
jgi:hypothetical protein